MSTPQTKYDALIIGSGQAGSPLAKAFAEAGRKTALVESKHIGGTCINEGCTPTKTMIASGRVAYLAKRSADYGVDVGAESIEMERVRARKRDIVRSFNGGSEARLRKAGVDVYMGTASFTGGPKEVRVRMQDGEKVLSSEVIVINVGDRPSRPSIPGLDTIDPAVVLDSTSIMELDAVPKHLVILGGGYIALEFGQLFRRLGAEVTIVQRNVQIIPREDPDVAKCMLGILEEDGIKVHLRATASSIKGGSSGQLSLEIQSKDGNPIVVSGTHLLLATGRVPNSDTLNLSAVGVKTTDRGDVAVNERLETNVEGIYAIGDVHGGPAFTHMSYDDFRILSSNLLQKASRTPGNAAHNTTRTSRTRALTPYVIYTDPQLGHVGLHARDLNGRNIKTASMPMQYVARALEMDETRGMMKATVDAETGEILGFTCLGIEGGEVMAVVQTAMAGGLKWWHLESAVWAHPSLAESLNNIWGFLE